VITAGLHGDRSAWASCVTRWARISRSQGPLATLARPFREARKRKAL
jgi:hypothetical protein